MAVDDETQAVLHAARALRRLADETLDRAHDLVAAGTMSRDELRELKEDVYWPLRRVAGSIVLKQARIEAARVKPHVDALRQATKRLENATEQVERTGQVVAISVIALSIVTSLLGVIFSPDSESLGDVVKRIGDLAGKIGEVATGEAEE